MKKEEKALLKDIAGMIERLIDMSGKEENQQQAAVEEENNHDDHEEAGIEADDIDFVKGMLEDDIQGLKFIAFCGDDRLARGQIGRRVFNAMCNAFLEKYA